MTVFVEVFWAGDFAFEGGDYLEPSTLLDCGCLGGFIADPVAGLDGASEGCTSRFILFGPGSNHSFVDGQLTQGALVRAAWLLARGDEMGSPDYLERGGAGETLLNRRDLSPSAFNFAVVTTKVSASLETCCRRPATSKWLKVNPLT